jgi:hypothetical protein
MESTLDLICNKIHEFARDKCIAPTHVFLTQQAWHNLVKDLNLDPTVAPQNFKVMGLDGQLIRGDDFRVMVGLCT